MMMPDFDSTLHIICHMSNLRHVNSVSGNIDSWTDRVMLDTKTRFLAKLGYICKPSLPNHDVVGRSLCSLVLLKGSAITPTQPCKNRLYLGTLPRRDDRRNCSRSQLYSQAFM